MIFGLKFFIKNAFDTILTNLGLIVWSLNFIVINFLMNFILILLIRVILKNLTTSDSKFYSVFMYVFKDSSILCNKKFYRNILIFTNLNFILSIAQVIYIFIHIEYIYVVYVYLVSVYSFIVIYIIFSYNNNMYFLINEYINILYIFIHLYKKYFYIMYYNIYMLNIKICVSLVINIQFIYYFFLINTESSLSIQYLLLYAWFFLILNTVIVTITVIYRFYNKSIFIYNILYDIIYRNFDHLVCLIVKKLVYFYKSSAHLNVKIYIYIYTIITVFIFITNIEIQNWFIWLNIINILSICFIKKDKYLLILILILSLFYSILLLFH